MSTVPDVKAAHAAMLRAHREAHQEAVQKARKARRDALEASAARQAYHPSQPDWWQPGDDGTG
jgi:hypothetical protein